MDDMSNWEERAKNAEAALARVEALSDEWSKGSPDGTMFGDQLYSLMNHALRAALYG
jgi:hypothetical protein